MPEWLPIQDPLARKIVIAAAAFALFVLIVRIFTRRRASSAIARRQRELRRSYEEVRLHQEEIKRLAAQIVATSSTPRIAGYAIVRQIEAVFSEGRPSSVAAVDLAKALAAQQGGNAVINLQTQQGPHGKWFASGDAVVVKVVGRRPAESPPDSSAKNT